jgi:hypothetical protein
MSDQWQAIDRNERGSLTAVSTVDNLSIVRLTADPATGALLVSTTGGGSFTVLPATGTVNGVNNVFTFTQKPSYLVLDHGWYAPTNSNGTTNWTWNIGLLQATTTIPPTEDCFGIA